MQFGRFRELQEFNDIERSDEHKRKDLVLYVLVLLHRNGWKFIPVPTLHKVWENYLKLLKRRGLEFEGFFQDFISGQWRELDDAIFDVRRFGYASYLEFDTGRNLQLNISEPSSRMVEKRADPAEWSIIEKSIPYLVRRIRKARARRWP